MSYDHQLSKPVEGLTAVPLKGARSLVLGKISNCKRGTLHLTDSFGSRTIGGSADVTARLTVHDPILYPKLLLRGPIAFGESYRDGDWSSPDMASVLEFFVLNRDALTGGVEYLNILRPLAKVYHWSKENTVEGSRENIEAHYDIGNDFYQLFLDRTMTYSSAYFAEPEQSLYQAQQVKLERLARKLNINPGDKVLEIGTGWGGLTSFLAENFDCQVTTTTISQEQYNWTVERIEKSDYRENVSVLKKDYRELSGDFDRIVSVEMLEAVGEEYLPVFFETLDDLLTSDGRVVLQTIHIRDQFYDDYRNNVDFIQRYIFPGGHLPSVGKVSEVLSDTNLTLTDLEEMGEHYVKTLEKWKNRLLDKSRQIEELGYDEDFLRLWEYYFCYCQAGFRTGLIGNSQLTLEKPRLLAG
ncbi:MAG: class I SAM-dependent methyltransferase [bacterium]